MSESGSELSVGVSPGGGKSTKKGDSAVDILLLSNYLRAKLALHI